MTATGAWLVDKPAGPTSHDVVARIRRGLPRGTKVGHTGTLDPFASGLLVVLTGRATRLAPYLTALDKTYVAGVQLGSVSATGDPEGPITPAGQIPPQSQVARALPRFVGITTQRVPAFAAVKVGGEALYKKARRGEAVDAPEREVTIRSLSMLGYDEEEGRLEIEVRCGKGTYVRQLAADIGERLGCGGYCRELRRTAVGDLLIADAVAPGDVDDGPGIGVRRALDFVPDRELTAAEAQAVVHGRPIPGDAADTGPLLLLYCGHAVAIGQAAGGVVHAAPVLVEADSLCAAGGGT